MRNRCLLLYSWRLVSFHSSPYPITQAHPRLLNQEKGERRKRNDTQKRPRPVEAECQGGVPALQVIAHVCHEKDQQRQVPHIKTERDQADPAQWLPLKWSFERGGTKQNGKNA